MVAILIMGLLGLYSTVKLSGGLLQNIAAESGLVGNEKHELGEAIRIHYRVGGVPPDIQGFFDSGQGAAFR